MVVLDLLVQLVRPDLLEHQDCRGKLALLVQLAPRVPRAVQDLWVTRANRAKLDLQGQLAR